MSDYGNTPTALYIEYTLMQYLQSSRPLRSRLYMYHTARQMTRLGWYIDDGALLVDRLLIKRVITTIELSSNSLCCL